MKKTALAILIAVLLGVSAQAGNEQKEKEAFWKKMLIKLGQIVPKKKLVVKTSVAGIRGVRYEDAESLYWKDEEKSIVVSEEELEAFKAAINRALEGDMDQARKMLKEFSATYPESPLRMDAKKAIGELKAGASQSP